MKTLTDEIVRLTAETKRIREEVVATPEAVVAERTACAFDLIQVGRVLAAQALLQAAAEMPSRGPDHLMACAADYRAALAYTDPGAPSDGHKLLETR